MTILETFQYTNPTTNTSIVFGDNSLPFVIYKGVIGTGMPTISNYAVETSYKPGAAFVRSKQNTRVLKVELVITGNPAAANPRTDLYNTLSTILAVLQPATNAAGQVTKVGGDGVTRVLNSVQYVGGFEVTDMAENYAYLEIELVFEAYDPNWYGQSTHQTGLGASTDPSGFTVPIQVPLIINGQATGSSTLVNNGNINANPIITFTGPLTDYGITNTTSGESFEITQQLFGGDTLVVDVAHAGITFTPFGGKSTPLYSSFGGGRAFPHVLPGSNQFSFFRDTAGNNQCFVQWSDTYNIG